MVVDWCRSNIERTKNVYSKLKSLTMLRKVHVSVNANEIANSTKRKKK